MSLLSVSGSAEAATAGAERRSDAELLGTLEPPRGRRRWGACCLKAAGLGLLGCLAGAAGGASASRWAAASAPWDRDGASVGESHAPVEQAAAPARQLEGGYKTAYITVASHPYKCLHILGHPSAGSTLKIWDCPTDEDLVTKFLLPVGVVGPIRPAADPELCLDTPDGNKLQLWSCEDVARRRSMERIHFLVRPEAPTWLRYEHYDLRYEQDVEQMSADDLGAVMDHVQENGYAGFAVWHGQAWIKGVQELNRNDLRYLGPEEPVVFYLFRPKGDFTIRSAHDPGLCVGTPGRIPDDGDVLHLFSCGTKGHYARLEETRFRLHYAFGDLMEQQQQQEQEESPDELQAQRSWHPQAKLDGGAERGRSAARSSRTFSTGRAARRPEVVVTMTLTNIDYGRLQANQLLVASLTGVIKDEISKAAGHGVSADDVTVVLRPGSVVVRSSIRVPEGATMADVTSNVQSSGTLKSAIADRVTELPGMADATTGVVGARHGGAQADASAMPAKLWSWITALLAAALIGLCLVAAYLERVRLRSLGHQLCAGLAQRWATFKAWLGSLGGEKSTALSIYKTREPVIDIDAPGVWRLGRIGDRGRPEHATYDVDLDSCSGGRAAMLTLGYGPINGQSPALDG